jgi:non-specific serine/threonine protein kinase
MAAEADCGLFIALLGPFDVKVHGRPLPRLRSKKGPWLLALLVLRHGHQVSREWIAETLWPDSLTEEALRNLRQSLTDLRKALGDQAARISSPTTRTLSLDLAQVEVDILTFDTAVRRQDTAGLEQAVGLYRGPLLEGCSEVWILPEREARQQAYRKALQRLAAYALAGGDTEGAVGYLRRAVAVEPLWEEARRELMAALAKSGDVNAAVQVYQELVHLLRDYDPRVMPGAETSALYHKLRAQARCRTSAPTTVSPLTPASSSPPGYLPRPLTGLVGRGEEVRQVTAQLRLSRLVTLTGAGGVGKTRLAIEVAEAVREEYADGAWFVELAALSDTSLLAQAVASILEVQEQPGRMLLQTLVNYLKPRALLLVLDNCEHLLQACTQLSEVLLRSCAGLRVLATSRQALGISGETAYRVPSLRQPDPHALSLAEKELVAVSAGYDAVRLFVERARAQRSDFALTRHNGLAVAEVCHRLDGIPLAIELAAAQVRALTVEQIVSRLDDRFGLLKGGSRTALPRQQTLRAALDWSYDLLIEPERLLLRRLSVFAGGWTLEAAERVCPGVGVEEWKLLDLLTSLVDKSLVVFDENGEGEGRYSLLNTIKQYGKERLTETEEEAMLRRRHRDYFLALADEAEPHLVAADQGVWLARLDQEHDNLRTALDWCMDDPEGAEIGLRITGALRVFWEARGFCDEGRKRGTTALLRKGAAQRTKARAKVLNGTGLFVWRQGDPAAAQEYIEESLSIGRELGDKEGISNSLHSMAYVALDRGDHASAVASMEESLAKARELGNTRSIAYALLFLGTASLNLQRDYAATRALCDEVLAIQTDLGDKLLLIHCLGLLGHIARAEEDYGQARMFYEQSLAVRRELGYRFEIAQSLEDFACLAVRQGEFYRATRLLGAAEALCEQIRMVAPVGIAEEYHHTVAAARSAAGDEAFAAGRTFHMERAIEYALEATEELA